MANTDFNVDIKDLEKFIKTLKRAGNGDFEKQIKLWFEALGFEFLDLVQDEIIRLKVVDTRLLLNSFIKGKSGNVWSLSDRGLTLEVGTNLNYAKFVNDGHYTCRQGVEQRFVPGRWEGDRFIYVRGSSTGMVLKQKWVEGNHFFESASRIFEKIFKRSLEYKLQEWLDKYF